MAKLHPRNLEQHKADIVQQAVKSLAQNQECYVAQWVLQNPNENIKDWILCHQPDWLGGENYVKFWMERK